MPHIRRALPALAFVAFGWTAPRSPVIASRHRVDPAGSLNRAQNGAANVYYLYGSDGTFSLTAETEVSGTITLAPAPLVVNKVQLAPSWACQSQSISGLAIRYQCIQQGVPTANTISGSGSVTIKNAFGTSGNNGTATFSFSCGQVSTKGCSGTISVKMPKLAQGT